MKMKKIMTALAMTMALSATASAGITVQTVESNGVGPTRQEAIKNALTEAVHQVNGLYLKNADVRVMTAENRATSQSKSGESSAEVSNRISSDLVNETQTKTQGSVKSYTVMDCECRAKHCEAKLSVDVYKYESMMQQNNRRRIAVLPFRQRGEMQAMFESQLNQSAVNYLTGTRHFSVLDRNYEDMRLGELESLYRADVNSTERARIGNSLGTDFIVTGSIEELHQTEKVVKIPFTNEMKRQSEVTVVVNWRVIEAATGQIQVSQTYTDKVRLNPEDANQGVLGRQVGESIGQSINNIIYPILVLAYKDNEKRVVLGQGGETLRLGTKYRLVKYGNLYEDPYTGEKMGREELPVGIVEISQITPKLSYADVIESSVDLHGAAPREYILRELTAAEKKAVKRKVKPTMQPAW